MYGKNGDMSHQPRPEGRIVEVANFGSRFEADSAIALLGNNGIEAMAKYGDAEGWVPNLGLLDGYRVMVFDQDLDAAKALIDSDDAFPPPARS
jgi:Putative prokaryotic signal transducing protein